MHRPRPARVWNAASLQGGTAPTPVREKRPKGACVQPTIPPLVPMPAQTAAKMRGSPPKALECSAETDSALEGAGFEPPVPLGEATGPRPPRLVHDEAAPRRDPVDGILTSRSGRSFP